MTVGWVAAATRGRSLLDRLIGVEGARALADTPTWSEARLELGTTIYGSGPPADTDRRTARRAAIEATVWQLRVLAGWLPPGTGGRARLFAAPMEIANIERRLRQLAGAVPAAPIPLGSLALVWPRIAAATSAADVRAHLARSPWGDPGGTDPITIGVGLRVGWARRVARQLPDSGDWARGATAVLLAREVFAFDRDIAAPTGRTVDQLIGHHWREARSIPDLVDRLPESAAWALETAATPADLWLAERAVAARIATDATRRARSRGNSEATVMAIMALILLDLWWVTMAIEAAGREQTEIFDAVA
jgi:hypothetical protein